MKPLDFQEPGATCGSRGENFLKSHREVAADVPPTATGLRLRWAMKAPKKTEPRGGLDTGEIAGIHFAYVFLSTWRLPMVFSGKGEQMPPYPFSIFEISERKRFGDLLITSGQLPRI